MNQPGSGFATEHPLRPYYVRPSTDHLLDASYSSPSYSSPSNASSHASSSRYARVDDLLDLDEGEGQNGTLRGLVSTGLLGFASTGLVQPFEVGKTLLQVQWLPRHELSQVQVDTHSGEASDDSPEFGANPEDEFSDEAEAEAYFADLTSRPPSRFPQSHLSTQPRQRDRAGYIQRRSIYDLSTKSEWTVPPVVNGGVWEMIRALGRWPGEGYLSLWKGQMTSFIIDSLSGSIQPFFLSLMTSALAPPSSLPSLPLVHSPHPTIPLLIHVGSHLITGLILSPLDLVRTRLIVQSRQQRYRQYTGPIHALQRIAAEEGGVSSIYFHANLFIPAILENTLRPLMHLASPLIIERVLNLSPTNNLFTYSIAEFVFGTASLLVTLPIETIRRRLQVQSRSPVVTKTAKSCVELRPVAYAGIVECAYRILTEETSASPSSLFGSSSRKRPKSGRRASNQPASQADTSGDQPVARNSVFGGLRQLYRGFGMGVTAQAIMLVLGLVGGRQSLHWAEV